MLRVLIVLLAAAVGLVATSASAADQPPAGTVSRVQGAAIAVQNATPRVLAVGDRIAVGDILSTGPNARLEIKMRDDAIFSLGEQAAFVVVDYTFGQGAAPNGVLRVLQGAFVATSGAIAQLSDTGFKVQTSAATIGIRGTAVWGGPLDGAPLQVMMIEGKAVTVETATGKVELNIVGAGTQLDANGAPTAPGFWGADKVARARAVTDFQ